MTRKSGGTLSRDALEIPGIKEQIVARTAIVARKMRDVLPAVMRAHGIDMWIILDREDNPDPLRPDVGGRPEGAGVRTVHIFYDRGHGDLEKIAISSHLLGPIVDQLYDHVVSRGYTPDGLHPDLKEVVESRDPQKIGINTSSTLPTADGLTAELKSYLMNAIGPKYSGRLVSAELLVRDFRCNHVDDEIPIYRKLCQWTVAWMEEALSPRVVRPSKTTADDVSWWMWEKAWELLGGVQGQPAVRIFRGGVNYPDNSKEAILPGDLVTLDAGLRFSGYATDMKRSIYVPHHNESELPGHLRQARAQGLEFRKIHTQMLRPGTAGTDVYSNIAEWAEQNGYQMLHALGGVPNPTYSIPVLGVYTHPIGYTPHDIGARVAEPWPMAFGDRVHYPLGVGHWYSMEYEVMIPMVEYGGRALSFCYEEPFILKGDGVVEFFVPTQNELPILGS